MKSNLYLQAKYLITIDNVKQWNNFQKNEYIRFRINSHYKNEFMSRPDKYLNAIFSEYVGSNVECYSIFMYKYELAFNVYDKIEEFLIKHKITVVRMPYGHMAGFLFPDKMYKDFFLLKYSESLPNTCMIF
jgi:hypothetical protein